MEKNDSNPLENEDEMSAIERFRFLLYACAFVLAIICFPFLLFSFPIFGILQYFGIDLILAPAIVFSCAYHWRQQSKQAKILTNVGRIFFWSLFAMRILWIIALMGILLRSGAWDFSIM